MPEGPAGNLDAVLDRPDAPPRAAVVVCHPHPQYGGTKENKVAFTLARAAQEAGCAAARFDFRGVGASEGAYDQGRGEIDDALAVADWARDETGCDRIVFAGFSFGAAVALRAALQRGAAGLITVALPADYFDLPLPRPDCPWLAVHGDADEVADPGAALEALQALEPAPDVKTMTGAGHFFHGRLTELRRWVSEWLASHVV